MAAANERQHQAAVAQARATAKAAAIARHVATNKGTQQQQHTLLAAPGLLGLGSADTVSAVRGIQAWQAHAKTPTTVGPHKPPRRKTHHGRGAQDGGHVAS